MVFTVLLLLTICMIVNGQENQDSTKVEHGGFFNNLGFDINARSQFNVWFSSEDRDDDEYSGAAINYETEGIQTWKIAGDLKWKGRNFIGGSFERPFHDTPEQREIIKKTTEIQTSLESYLFYLQLPFLRSFTKNAFVDFLSDWRFDYRRYLFYGKGISVEPAVFVARNGEQSFLNINESFRFKSSFQDWDLTYLFASHKNGGLFRIGIYWSQINKPYETRYSIMTDTLEYAQVTETKLSGFGGMFDIEAPFLRFILKAGSAKFESMGKLEGYDPFQNTGSFDFLLYLRWWTTIDLLDNSKGHSVNKLTIKPIFTGQFRADYLSTSTINESIYEDEFTMDIILDVGISISWLYF
jgi:hypothetical protein